MDIITLIFPGYSYITHSHGQLIQTTRLKVTQLQQQTPPWVNQYKAVTFLSKIPTQDVQIFMVNRTERYILLEYGFIKHGIEVGMKRMCRLGFCVIFFICGNVLCDNILVKSTLTFGRNSEESCGNK